MRVAIASPLVRLSTALPALLTAAALSCVAAFVLVGCVRTSVFRYINNSADEIVLKGSPHDVRIPPGGSFVSGAGLYIDFSPMVVKTMQKQQLTYDFRGVTTPAPFTTDLRARRRAGQVDLVLQYQDKKIYLLYPTNTLPTTNIPPQPAGFPLLPINPDQYWAEADWITNAAASQIR